jgi:hypothetical protein
MSRIFSVTGIMNKRYEYVVSMFMNKRSAVTEFMNKRSAVT